MATTNAYTVTATVKAWAQVTVTTDDTVIEMCENAAARMIDNACGWHFYQSATTASRDCVPRDLYELNFGGQVGGLVTATSIAIDPDGDGTFEVALSASDYQLVHWNDSPSVGNGDQTPYTKALSVGGRYWPIIPRFNSRAARVRITGTFGWPAVPDPITLAATMLAARLYKRRGTPEGVLGFSDFGGIRVTKIDPDIDALLAPYKHGGTTALVA